jgi:phytanoyl-CoA hydroxylase
MSQITKDQWDRYDNEGYLHLGRLLDGSALEELQNEIDAIMMGTAPVDYDQIMMQLDSTTGKTEDAGPQSLGSKGKTLNYRKIQNLENDPLFLAYLQRPVFRDACAHVYGEDRSISVFRAMFMNKPANRGTWLPWHQDRWTFIEPDPLLTIWTALDPATKENGCVQVVPGSHRNGLINPGHLSGFLTEEQAREHCPPEKIVHLELKAGEVILLHNYLLHASDINRSAQSRRAFSVCYMDASTRDTRDNSSFPIAFDGQSD